MNDIVTGFKYPFKGLKFILQNKKLWNLAIIPVIINILLFSIFFYFTITSFSGWLASILSSVWYLQVLYYLILVISVVLLFVIIIYLFTAVTNLIAGPFNDVLSEKTEMIVSKSKEEKFSFKFFVFDIFITVGQETKKISLFVFIQIGLFFLNFIPVLGNILFTFFSLIMTAWLLAFEFIDYPLARKHWDFFQKKQFILSKNKFFTLGFGLAVAVLLFIPFLNLVLIPCCVVGGTLLYLDLKK